MEFNFIFLEIFLFISILFFWFYEDDLEAEEKKQIIEMSKKCRGSYVIYNFIQTFEKYFKCNMFELFIHLFKK